MLLKIDGEDSDQIALLRRWIYLGAHVIKYIFFTLRHTNVTVSHAVSQIINVAGQLNHIGATPLLLHKL